MHEDLIILCSNARLARGLRLAHDAAQLAAGRTQWQPLRALTLAQWLGDVTTRSLLAGEIPCDAFPSLCLDDPAEQLLWEDAIAQTLSGDAAEALFDVAGMAQTAAESNALMLEWGISPPAGEQAEETRQFLRWREAFQALCRKHGALEPARLREFQIDALRRGAGRLPKRIELAGFDRFSPQDQRLLEILKTRGVELTLQSAESEHGSTFVRVACDDAEAECRSAVAWVAQNLASNPSARLAVVVPELAALRERLAALLDDVLHPATVFPAHAEARRCYDMSLGRPLAAQPLVATALSLLEMAVQRQRFPQADFGRLLRDGYWSDAGQEADARALLDARMRRRLPPMLKLGQLLRFVRETQRQGLPLSALVSALQGMLEEAHAWPRRARPSNWCSAFLKLLAAAGWPGTRGLSSHEFQARCAWNETLAEFASLDGLLGDISPQEACARLARICRKRIFQPEVEGLPQVLVMGMLEAPAMTLDALWVMGMNDHNWPPPARPNPLLPAAAQRAVRAPNADASVQAEFATRVLNRILASAPQGVLSWARREGEQELRPSPFLASFQDAPQASPSALTLAEQLAMPADMQWLEDRRAPPVDPGEVVRGGTGLLRAQAVCPAWAFFQYRLGARVLEEPVEGLDAIQRGTLLHTVLHCFWQGRDSAFLHELDDTGLSAAIAKAVEMGLARFSEKREEPLLPNFLNLESQRLKVLLAAWLAYEKTRPPFAVEACEHPQQLDIAGIQVNLILDRIDRLPDGRQLVLDYKTGSKPDPRSWVEDRITEPQLPVYAALAMAGGQVAAVCFAKVRADEQKFIGVAAETDLLPDVKGLADARGVYPEEKFPDWEALIDHWRERIQAIAAEIRAGEAAVTFADENDLRHCDVKPLLRLPERRLQMERSGS